MQKNHPKSNALRQTKICMAVAAVVTAAALPGYAVADAVQVQAPQWEQDQRSRVAALGANRGPIKTATEENYTKTQELADKRELADLASALTAAVAVGDDDAERFESFKAAISEIDRSLEILEGRRAKDGQFHGLDDTHNSALTALKAAVVAIDNESKFTSGPDRNNLNRLILTSTHTSAVAAAQSAATVAAQNLALFKHKLTAVTAVESEEDAARLAATYLLDVNASGADRNGAGVLSWNDKNLKTSMGDDPAARSSAHALILADKVVEIGSFSGETSDAVHGADSATRAIGTIRALEGANHNVQVASGRLNIHQGIDGNGALTVTAGVGGIVNFVAQEDGNTGGITGEKVTLVAGSATGGGVSAGDRGAINFERGMSAGTAEIDLHSGGRLAFNAGSNAGDSVITVNGAVTAEMVQDRVDENSARTGRSETALPTLTQGIGATLAFDESSAGNAAILNSGNLTFVASDLSNAELVNDESGTVAIRGKMVTVNPVGGGSGVSEMQRSSGGKAEFLNKGTLTAENMDLDRMSLINGGTATISQSDGGTAFVLNNGRLTVAAVELRQMELANFRNVTISNSNGGSANVMNGQEGDLTFTDTDLQRLALANEGAVKMTGRTTATNASIALHSGSLDVSEIAISDIEAGEGKPENSLTIGSLTGKGDVVTGNTVLMLGELGNDDRFDGKISREAAQPDTQAYPNVLHAHVLPSQPVGSEVVKVGTGNLTLFGDQSGVANLSVQGGKLTAAHANALGSGDVNVAKAGTIALSTNVSGVNNLQNDGTLDLGVNKLEVGAYASEAGATIKSRVEKVDGQATGGTIQVEQESDFSNTEIEVAVADDIELSDVVGKFQVVEAADGVEVTGGKLKVGSITGGKQADPLITGTEDPIVDPVTKITDKNIVKFLAADGGYSANEQAVLASVDGVTVGDLASGKIGGKVLSAMALQTAGTEEQRRSARMLSGESLVNNAVAAQAAATSFQRGMQTRMIAGGAMFDDKTANGAMVADNGVAGWASFNGGKTSQRGDGMSFDVKGLDGAIGVDKRLNQNTLVGGSIGFGNQESKAKGLPGESKVNSVSVGLYGSHLTGSNWFVNGGASYTNHSVKTDRTVAARNASARVAGKTSGQTFGMFGEVGKRFEVSGVNIDPSVGVRVASTRLKAFDETNRDGSGNDGLKVGSQSQTSTRGVLGVRLWSEVASIAGGKVAPSLRLSYEHEFGKTQSSLTNAIYGAPSSFTVKGPKLGKDIFTADLGLDMQLKKQLEVRVGGNVSVRKGESALGGGISAKYRF